MKARASARDTTAKALFANRPCLCGGMAAEGLCWLVLPACRLGGSQHPIPHDDCHVGQAVVKYV